MSLPTLYESSVPGRCAVSLPEADVPPSEIPRELLRGDNGLPELSQLDVVRHYLRLSQRNFGVDSGFYPLGSCTMKYNPKVSEEIVRRPAFAQAHPLQSEATVQGSLALMYRLQEWLAEIGGFAAVTLQPAAGAQGELTALLMMRAYHRDRGEDARSQVLIPDSAHGTNPASTTMAGFETLQIPSDERGNVDLAALAAACDERVVALMLTNPNTFGLFEERLEEVVGLVHGCGGLVYGDGANLNALAGIVRPGELGFDLMHFNLHKTFGTPHGGGGPGSGPVGASAELADYLPAPRVVTTPAAEGEPSRYRLVSPPRSIGRVCAFHGSFATLLRAYVYLRLHGPEGLRANSMHAVLNANYLRAGLRGLYPLPFDRPVMHELVCQARFEGSDVHAIDVCKRLMDHGFHPPTSYFPLSVPEALMIEPTESESRETLDAFLAAMAEIRREVDESPELLRAAPHATPVRRLDEVAAARRPVLRQRPRRAGGEDASNGSP